MVDRGVVTTRSALALKVGKVLTEDVPLLAKTMNEAEGKVIWEAAWELKTIVEFRKNLGHGPFAAAMEGFNLEGKDVAHMIIVDGLDGAGNVLIRDPLAGTKYAMSSADFIKYWSGMVLRKIVP